MSQNEYFKNISNWEKIELLTYAQDLNNYIWAWAFEKKIWADVTLDGKKNLFSQVGIGARNAIFVIRNLNKISLNHAIKYKNKYYFITLIENIDDHYKKITAAEMLVVDCKHTSIEYRLNEYNRPVENKKDTISFQCCITEKYIQYTETPVSANTETMLVAITPKVIDLNVGDAVEVLDESTVKNGFYIVQKVHKLDEYKNEYEVLLRDDV